MFTPAKDDKFAKNLFDGVDITPVDRMPDFLMGPTWMGYADLKVQQRDRLKSSNDTLYEAIVRRLGAKSSQHAWHIRTAEIYNMYCFLSVDHKLIKNVTAQSKHEPLSSLTTKVLRPAELGPGGLSVRNARTFTTSAVFTRR